MADGNGRVIGKLSPSFEQTFDDITLISNLTLRFNSLVPSFTTANLVVPFA